MRKVVFQMESLTCPSCIKKIETMLGREAGVKSAKVLFHSSKVRVEFDEGLIKAEQLEDKIEKLGYPVLSKKVS